VFPSYLRLPLHVQPRTPLPDQLRVEPAPGENGHGLTRRQTNDKPRGPDRLTREISQCALHRVARHSGLVKPSNDRCIPPASLRKVRCPRARQPLVVDGPGSRQRVDGGVGVRAPDAATHQTLLQSLPRHVTPRDLAPRGAERFGASEFGSKASKKWPVEQSTAREPRFHDDFVGHDPPRAAVDLERDRARPSPPQCGQAWMRRISFGTAHTLADWARQAGEATSAATPFFAAAAAASSGSGKSREDASASSPISV
jgi:hypothetical protein